jgi:hypothetical protein
MEEGIAERIALGESMASFGTWLAEAYGKVGRHAEGLSLIARDLEAAHEIFVYEPERYRVKGELLLMQDASSVAESEHCYRTAIEMTRAHGSKLLELRATTSLARLLKTQGRHEEGRTMLADVYNWFTEGFDTADLKDAKALLDELGA